MRLDNRSDINGINRSIHHHLLQKYHSGAGEIVHLGKCELQANHVSSSPRTRVKAEGKNQSHIIVCCSSHRNASVHSPHIN